MGRAQRVAGYLPPTAIPARACQSRGCALVSWECARGDGDAHAARRCRDRVDIAALARAGSRRPRTHMPASARSVLESARLASCACCVRDARAREASRRRHAGHEAS
eukprot:5621078-Prymnesium_polylepis.2